MRRWQDDYERRRLEQDALVLPGPSATPAIHLQLGLSVAERALVCVVTEAHGRTAVRAAVERLKSGAENSEPSGEETNAYGLVGKY